MKTVLFVPGFREFLDSRDYCGLLAAIEGLGFNARFVDIDWANSTPDDWAAQLNAVYSQFDAAEVVLAGFSFGAVTTLISAAERNPSELWLFSLSPYFAEDFPLDLRWLNNIGKRRADYFRALKFRDLGASIGCVTKIWVGSLEHQKSLKRSEVAAHYIERSNLNVVEGAGHDVAHAEYVGSIVKELNPTA